MLRYEWKKMLRYRRGILYVFLFLVMQTVLLCFSDRTDGESLRQTREDYGYYMPYLEGPLTEDKKEYLEAESLRLSEASLELSQLRQSYYSGKISREEYREKADPLEEGLGRQTGFQEIFNQYIYIRMAPEERYFLYTRGWDRLLSEQKVDYLGLLLLLILIVPVFCQEYSCGMDQLIVTSGRGARSQVRCKAAVGILTAAAVGCASIVIEYVFVLARYGLPQGSYPIQSLESYQSVEKVLSLRQAFWLQAGMKLFGYIYCAVILLWISSWVRKVSVALAVSTAVTVLPFWMVENYHPFTRIPGPWGPLVGTVFLSGTETAWNYYLQREELISTELGWGEWGMILTASCGILCLMILLLHQKNGNQWIKNTGKRRRVRGMRAAGAGCLLLVLAGGFLCGCGSPEESGEETEYRYNSSRYLCGETEGYLFYYLIDDQVLMCEDKETGERFPADRDALQYDRADGDLLSNPPTASRAVFTAGKYAYYIRTDYVSDYWNLPGNSDTIRFVELDTEDFSERTVLELYMNGSMDSLAGLRQLAAIDPISPDQFIVHEGEVYLMPYQDGVYRLGAGSGLEELVISQVKAGNIACDGEYIYYKNGEELLVLYDMETGDSQVIEDVAAADFFLGDDGVYFVNLRDDRCIYRWEQGSGSVTKLGDTRTLWLDCDTEYIYYVEEETSHLYRMDKDGQNPVLVTEEYPVVLYVFDGFDRMYMAAVEGDGFRWLQIDKHSLEIREMDE